MTYTTDDFDELYVHYRPYIDAYVRRRIDEGAVEDVVAEVFTTTWRRITELPHDALPWLYATARNTIGTRYRSDERFQLLAKRLAMVPAERTGRDPADALSEREQVALALGSLSDTDRELVILTTWDGLSIGEVATVLNISPGNASVRLHRVRKRLRDALHQQNEPTLSIQHDPNSEEHNHG